VAVVLRGKNTWLSWKLKIPKETQEENGREHLAVGNGKCHSVASQVLFTIVFGHSPGANLKTFFQRYFPILSMCVCLPYLPVRNYRKCPVQRQGNQVPKDKSTHTHIHTGTFMHFTANNGSGKLETRALTDSIAVGEKRGNGREKGRKGERQGAMHSLR